MATFFQKNKWDIEILLGSYKIDTTNGVQQNGLCDEFNLQVDENQARTCTFSIIPPRGAIIPEQYQGKSVKVNLRNAQGWWQIFDGYVDLPRLDFMTRKLTFSCSDQRSNRIIKLPIGSIKLIGSYSEAVFGTPRDKSAELENRLQTVAASYDFDNYGKPQLTPWLPKVVPDFTFNSDGVYWGNTGSPTVEYTNHKKAVNTINITVDYSYQRLHQQACFFRWQGYVEFLDNWWRVGKPSFPPKESIQSAATSTDWKLVQDINFVNLWPAQSFGSIGWQPNQVEYEYANRFTFAGYLKDSTGGFVTVGSPPRLSPIWEVVNDRNGNPVKDVVKIITTDTSSMLCKGANWASALRFAQTVKEHYTIQMRAPQAITKNGVVESFENVSITDPYDTSTWEKSDVVSFTTDNFYINKNNRFSDVKQAIQVSLNKARHDLLELQRDTIVKFRTVRPFPQIDLKHTVEIDVDHSVVNSTVAINAKGKVGSITHNINMNTLEAYTSITLFLSRAQGTATTSPFQVQVPIEDPLYIGQTKSISLGTYVGLNPDDTNLSQKWTGWIGNREYTKTTSTGTGSNTTTWRTNYPEQFIIDFPAIPDALRNEIVYTSDNTLTLEIPNDLLETYY